MGSNGRAHQGGIGVGPIAGTRRSAGLKRTWLIVVVLALAGAAGYWYLQSGGDDGTLDLVEAFRGAEKRTPLNPAAAFSMDPQTIKGETKPTIYAHPPSRIIFHDVQVPPDARLELFLAIKEEAWPKGTDGVYFRVGVSQGETYTDLLKRHVDPYKVDADRGWIPVSIDLSAYAGQTVNVIFNTHESLPGTQPNGLYDFAMFGAPRIVAAPPS
jgi:hypothetical protein